MKKKEQRFLFRFICIVLSVLLIGGVPHTSAENAAEEKNTTAASDDHVNQSAGFLKKGRYTSAEEMIGEMTAAATVGDTVLYYHPDTADIAVVKSDNGKIWLSSPFAYQNDGKASDEIKAQLASFIRLVYYDQQSNQFEMNGYEDCIAKNQFEIVKIENGIEINMRLGKDEDQLTLPVAAEAEQFEKKVLSKLSGIAERRVKAFYTRYSTKDDSLDQTIKERLLALYPGLADHDFYILREDASDRDKQQLTEYLASTEYTLEDYRNDLIQSGAADQGSAAALFKLTVRIVLDGGDLLVSVPTDSISYDRNSFVLNKVILFEYFGAGESGNEGYLFVPNGSGSLIRFNTDGAKKILDTVCPVYGQDNALLQNEEYQNIAQQCYLPVYGVKESDRAFLAVIEQGDAMAQIIGRSGNIVSGYETVLTEFTYASVQTYLYRDGKKQNGQWTYFSKKYYEGDFMLRYRFLSGEEATYSGMAKSYREYLKDKKVLKKAQNQAAVPLYLEAVGQITRKDTFFGIPYNRKIDITNFADAQNMMEELREAGVDFITLRYKGWMNGGLNTTVSNGVSVEKKLGGTKGLKRLNAYMKKNGFAFFPEVSFQIVRRNTLFDGFAPLFDSPRSNDDHIAYMTPPEERNNISDQQNLYAAISPIKIGKYYQRFFKKYNSLGTEGVALLYAGNMLYSDFSKDHGVTRQEAVKTLTTSIEKTVKGSVMTDGGNAYIYPYADDILGMPTANGGNITEDQSIPFMQMVLHGYIRYAGNAINLSDNAKTELLKTAEYGGNLYFTVGYQNTEYLKDTTLSYLYSVDYQTWKNDMITLYQKYNRVFAPLQGMEIVSHEKKADDLYQTTYENGATVIVNYGEQAVTVDGVLVEAMDFTVLS